MNNTDRVPKIFISYAREDGAQAEALYQFLSRVGFQPWMDTHDLLPGVQWGEVIENEIRTSDFFVACVSRNSVNKEGEFQREIKRALNTCEKMPEGRIYLIPIRLDDTQPPERMSSYQWVDLFEKDGWSKLEAAIRKGKYVKPPQRVKKPSLLKRYRYHAGLLFILLVLINSPRIYNNYFYRVPRLEVPTTFCKASQVPVKVGVADLPNCSTEFREILTKNWKNGKGDVSDIPGNFETSLDARSSSGDHDIVVWGACSKTIANSATLQFELITSRKPFEIYEPTTLKVVGADNLLSNLGLAIINYRFGDFSGALRLFGSLPGTTASADLMLLEANSLLFDLQPVPAISEFKEITREFASDSAGAYNNLGVVVTGDDRIQALGWFNQAVNLAEDNQQVDVESLARVNRSLIFLSDRKWNEALDDCDTAVLLNPKSALPYICLARYNFSYFRFGAPWLPLPLNEIDKNLNKADSYPDAPPITHYLRADWHLSHFSKQKQEAVSAYSLYLSDMEYRACLQTEQNRIQDTQGFLDELTINPK